MDIRSACAGYMFLCTPLSGSIVSFFYHSNIEAPSVCLLMLCPFASTLLSGDRALWGFASLVITVLVPERPLFLPSSRGCPCHVSPRETPFRGSCSLAGNSVLVAAAAAGGLSAAVPVPALLAVVSGLGAAGGGSGPVLLVAAPGSAALVAAFVPALLARGSLAWLLAGGAVLGCAGDFDGLFSGVVVEPLLNAVSDV